MHQAAHHDALIKDFVAEFNDIFEHSDQSVYVYLDDTNKACNGKFATLLGYASAEEWAAVSTPFPPTFVGDKSQHDLVTAYQAAMEKKIASTVPIYWKKKSGETVATSVILVPVVFQGHLLALHFVTV